MYLFLGFFFVLGCSSDSGVFSIGAAADAGAGCGGAGGNGAGSGVGNISVRSTTAVSFFFLSSLGVSNFSAFALRANSRRSSNIFRCSGLTGILNKHR